MIMFILSVLLGTAFFVLMGFILRPIFMEIRDFTRGFLYLIGIDTFSRKDKIELGWIQEDKAPPVQLKANMVSNCILSKENFPNIAEYFPDYKEYEVVQREPPKEKKEEDKKENVFSTMTYKQQLVRIGMLHQKKREGTLDPLEEAQLKILSDPKNLDRAKQQEAFLKRLRDY